MTLGEWRAIMQRVAGLYPNASFGASTVAAYFDELHDFDADLVEGVVRTHARESNFFPSVHELLSRLAIEQRVRDEYERLPDFTNFDQLSEAEQVARLEAGLRRSVDVEKGNAERAKDAPKQLPAADV